MGLAGQGGTGRGRESRLTWTVVTDILRWCVFVGRSYECAAWTGLLFGVVASGARSVRRASALGKAAL